MAADSAAMNMAVDEALLLAYLDRASPQTIRLYPWRNPSVTFGRRIDPAAIDVPECADGDVVRRPTGGGVVCHRRSLTVSIAGDVISLRKWAEGEGLQPAAARRAGARHRALNSAVGGALAASGVDCSLVPAAASWGGGLFCFSSVCAYDIVSCGRKIYGSAQLVDGGAFLYQGNLLVEEAFDTRLFGALFRQTLEEKMGWKIEEGALTAAEAEEAERLRREKYACAEWNLFGNSRRAPRERPAAAYTE